MKLERDPVCGVKVDPSECEDLLHTISFKGKDFYFCSPSCKVLFTEDTEHYLLLNLKIVQEEIKDEKDE